MVESCWAHRKALRLAGLSFFFLCQNLPSDSQLPDQESRRRQSLLCLAQPVRDDVSDVGHEYVPAACTARVALRHDGCHPSTQMYSPCTLTASLASGRGGGPLMTCPVGEKTPAWQGQKKRASSPSHLMSKNAPYLLESLASPGGRDLELAVLHPEDPVGYLFEPLVVAYYDDAAPLLAADIP